MPLSDTAPSTDGGELVDTAPAHLMAVTPPPTDDEVVAIMAGVEALWPKPVVVLDEPPRRNTAWRFSGRWWSRPISARRARPYR